MDTMNRNWMLRLRAAAWSAALSLTIAAHAQLRIVDYNTAGGPRAGMGTILQAIGDEQASGIVKQIDVLSLQEQNSSATTTQSIVNILNGIYGPGTYSRATLDGGTTGAGRPGLIYNTQTVQLIEQTTASTTSSSGAARQTMRYRLRPLGYDVAADFYLYSSHYKASDTSADAARRNVEAQQVRANANALGSAHLIYSGDFNIYRSTEPMWATLTGAGSGQAFDPINRIGAWHDGASFRDVHTQNPAGSGFVGGGMDDRFDFQLLSGEMLDNEGMSLIPGTYRAFGNTNTHSVNGAITSGSAAALQARLLGYTQPQAQAVLNGLAAESDHLPVVADYQLPAKMSVNVGSITGNVIVGASVPIEVIVANVAPVAQSIGADELEYSVSGLGAVSGSASGVATATFAGNAHALLLDTSTPGLKTGTVSVSSTSQSAASGSFSQSVSKAVFAHATPSFTAGSQSVSHVIDFGIRALNSTHQPQDFSILNLVNPSGFTAALDVDSITGTGDSDRLLTNLVTSANNAAGSTLLFNAWLDTQVIGDSAARYVIGTSDEDLPGAQEFAPLSLELHGIVALGGDADLDGNVDVNDLGILASNWQAIGTWLTGDFSGDGFVDVADLGLLAENWQESTALDIVLHGLQVPTTVVPEPGPTTVLLCAFVATLQRARPAAMCHEHAT
jgi:hypothetical protein